MAPRASVRCDAHGLLDVVAILCLTCLGLVDSAGAAGDGGILAPDAVSAFRANGHLLSKAALPRAEVEGVAQTLSGLMEEHGRRAFADDGGQKEVRFTFAVHELSEVVAAFIADRNNSLWRAAAELAGTSELCLLMDRGFTKDPGDKETHWHRDDEAIGLPNAFPNMRTVHAWIPLSAMDSSLGTLQYLLGSHDRSPGWLMQLIASMWGWEFAWFAMLPRFLDDHLEIGDVAWHDGWTLHSAGANSGGAVRHGLAASFAYCPQGGCGGAEARRSEADATCLAAEQLFDEGWRARHRSGEEDYAKHYLAERSVVHARRFVWRSVVGALAGFLVHRAVTWIGTRAYKQKAA